MLREPDQRGARRGEAGTFDEFVGDDGVVHVGEQRAHLVRQAVEVADHARTESLRALRRTQRILREVRVDQQHGVTVDEIEVEARRARLHAGATRQDEATLPGAAVHEHDRHRGAQLRRVQQSAHVDARVAQRPAHEATVAVVAERGEHARPTAQRRDLSQRVADVPTRRRELGVVVGAHRALVEALHPVELVHHAETQPHHTTSRHDSLRGSRAAAHIDAVG